MQRARVVIVLASVVLAAALSGCTDSVGGGSTPSQTAWSEQPSAQPTGSGSGVFSASGSASDNKAAFDAAIRKVLAGNAKADGDTVVAALKAAGFPMDATQVTASTTSANLQPGSIMVGIKVGNQCLVGQWGTAVDGYQSSIAPVLGSGGCLIGGIPVVG